MNDSERRLKAKADEEQENMWQHTEKYSLKPEPSPLVRPGRKNTDIRANYRDLPLSAAHKAKYLALSSSVVNETRQQCPLTEKWQKLSWQDISQQTLGTEDAVIHNVLVRVFYKVPIKAIE